jgi:hypothetical protein
MEWARSTVSSDSDFRIYESEWLSNGSEIESSREMLNIVTTVSKIF